MDVGLHLRSLETKFPPAETRRREAWARNQLRVEICSREMVRRGRHLGEAKVSLWPREVLAFDTQGWP
jgi:hypothetical protein